MPENRYSILIVDDDAQIRELLVDYLGEAGYEMHAVPDGAGYREAIESNSIDLVILDLLLPDVDGMSLARELRQKHDIPLIMLTTKSEELERIIGLEVGADDYVSKPFSPRELLARVKSLFRRIELATEKARMSGQMQIRVRFDAWELDLTSRQLTRRDGFEPKLTNSEFQLLSAFVQRPQRVLSRDQLLELSRKNPEAVFDRSIDYLILRLRRKIEDDPRSPRLITTEHGAGYIFTPKVQRL